MKWFTNLQKFALYFTIALVFLILWFFAITYLEKQQVIGILVGALIFAGLLTFSEIVKKKEKEKKEKDEQEKKDKDIN
ncbi:MAG: hypothetical protein U9Q83_09420 [Bacteroidota bacterium]|nr:hypothetical protein [Bacteroidota bacterium]